MISHLSIKNFAIISDLSVDFGKGLQILTGETGTGKSIIIEAISLALGSRADTSYVRTGEDKARIQLVIDVDDPVIADFLSQQEVDETDKLIITREIFTSGKSTCKLNGEIVSLSFLNKICGRLVDIHGQYDHQSLLSAERHIDFIDAFCADELKEPKMLLAESYETYYNARQEYSSLSEMSEDRNRKFDFMQYEYKEIQDANLRAGEDSELEDRLSLLQNSEKILNGISMAYEFLTDESTGAFSPLSRAKSILDDISQYDKALYDFGQALSDSYYRLEDLSAEMRRYRDHTSYSPEDINAAIARMDCLDTLKRKHGGSIENIIAYGEKIAAEIAAFQNSDERLSELTDLLPKLEKDLVSISRRVSDIRKNAALKFEKLIQKELLELNFINAGFQVAFHPAESSSGSLHFTKNGIDNIEFMLSPNKGEALKPLSKIASGGEISRIMLAFKSVISSYDHTPSMIFDEIDTGISGSTASIVGRKMLDISKSKQVLCITHLPQVAAFGDLNYKIVKQSDDQQTFAQIVPLSEQEKTAEIARMLGGIAITESATKNAQDLIYQSRKNI